MKETAEGAEERSATGTYIGASGSPLAEASRTASGGVIEAVLSREPLALTD
jgi:hypothetical protein